MKVLLRALIASLLLIQGTIPQANAHSYSTGSVRGRAQAQSAELAEADRLNQSIVQLHKEGKDDEALPLAARVLEIREHVLGPDHKLVAFALFNLGELNFAGRNYKAAEPFYKRALSILEKSPGTDDALLGKVLSALGLLQYLDRDYGKSEDFYKRALEVNEKTFGAESLEAARALLSLAELYRVLNRHMKAERLFLQLLAIEKKFLQPDDDELIQAQERYTCLLYESNKLKEAYAYQKILAEERKRPATLISDQILNGRALSLPRPEYPQDAIRVRAYGVVIVKVTIDEAGKVIEAKATCGNPYLRKASEAAAARARFSPTFKDGQAVKVTGIVTYNFMGPR
jgi:TonB family protein